MINGIVSQLRWKTLVRGSAINVLVGSLLGAGEHAAAHHHPAAIIELAMQKNYRKGTHQEIYDGKGSGPAAVFAKVPDDDDKIKYHREQIHDSSLERDDRREAISGHRMNNEKVGGLRLCIFYHQNCID